VEVYENMRDRGRMALLLNERQSALLDEALALSLAPSRSLFVAEAINAGLANPKPQPVPTTRRRRVNVWLPSAMRERVRELASVQKVTQQEIVKHFLLEYIRAARWKMNRTRAVAEEELST
jgi:metal-responsive CopG/Arc/MetJ family transcriptional regulator